jgi:hypothetical protein
MTQHQRLCAVMVCLLYLGVTTRGATAETRLPAYYGTPVIDGAVTPGEWPSFTELNLTLTEAIRITPPTSLLLTIALLNTGAQLSLALQIPHQLPANRSTSDNPPYHANALSIYVDDFVNRTIYNETWSVISFHMGVEALNDTVQYALFHPLGAYPVGLVAHDPTKPWGAVTFTPSPSEAPRGTYTFEIAFPLSLELPRLDPNGRAVNVGLRPVPTYHVFRLDFGQGGSYGQTYTITYTTAFTIDAAFDPLALLPLVALVAVVVVLLICCVILPLRARKRTRRATTPSPSEAPTSIPHRSHPPRRSAAADCSQQQTVGTCLRAHTAGQCGIQVHGAP